MKDVVIASACRTAIGTFGGSLRDSHAATIAGVTMKAAVDRAGIDPSIIDDVRYGCCMEPVDALNVARIAALLAGIPASSTAVTINRVCISGMEAVISGMAMIQAGMADVIDHVRRKSKRTERPAHRPPQGCWQRGLSPVRYGIIPGSGSQPAAVKKRLEIGGFRTDRSQ
jgi:hypothetical protein